MLSITRLDGELKEKEYDPSIDGFSLFIANFDLELS